MDLGDNEVNVGSLIMKNVPLFLWGMVLMGRLCMSEGRVYGNSLYFLLHFSVNL